MIDPVRGGGGAYAPRPAARRAGTGFTLPEARAAGAGAAAPAAGVGALLGLQGEMTPEERDDAAQRRGGALLDEMEGLRRDMLRGRLDPARLSRLALLAEGECGADPALRDVVEGIALRAQVEIARFARQKPS